MQRQSSERAIVLLVAVVQFVNILDFMMVMPMGPYFAASLGIPLSRLGFIGGSYTAAAMASGLVGSAFLDRFGRRNALVVALLGLSVGTALGGVAHGFGSLLLARVLAGAFGGPATAVSLSIIADTVPAARRGRAMGEVMRAFSVASVLGVPFGLELAHRWSWRAPFFCVAAAGLLVSAATAALLPPLRDHLTRKPPATDDAPEAPSATRLLLRKRTVQLAYLMSATSMMGGFVLIPNITPYLVQNLGYPRAGLGRLYFFGGLCSFLTLQFAGRLVDRWGGFRVAAPATLVIAWVVFEGFVRPHPWMPPVAFFVLWMSAMGFRNVGMQATASRVPSPTERARFMSLQSAVQHGASSLGAMVSTRLLREGADHRLSGMSRVAVVTVTLFAALPFLLAALERRLKGEAGLPAAAAHARDGHEGEQAHGA